MNAIATRVCVSRNDARAGTDPGDLAVTRQGSSCATSSGTRSQAGDLGDVGTRSGGRVSPVHGDRRTRDIRSVVGREEADRCGDVGGGRDPAERDR